MSRSKKGSKQRVGSMLDDALFYDARVGELSKDAFKLLIEAVMMENNYNNGNIALAEGTLRLEYREKTLIKARKELIELELIEEQKHGIFGKPNLYSLCHKPVVENKKLGIRGAANAKRRATGVHPNKKYRGAETPLLRGAKTPL